MIETFSAMLLMASTVLLDRAAALLRVLGRRSIASCSVWRLFSAFWRMEADICSRLDVVSSTEAACSLVPWERACEVAETCVEAEESPVAPVRISVMVCGQPAHHVREGVAERVPLGLRRHLHGQVAARDGGGRGHHLP